MPISVRLQQVCRRAAIEVTYTVVESMTADGRDRSLDYKITGFHVPKGSADARMVSELAPRGDEMLFPKTSSSVFISTNIDYVLRNLGTKYLIIAGCLTDQCVDSAVRDACDLGYLVTPPTDHVGGAARLVVAQQSRLLPPDHDAGIARGDRALGAKPLADHRFIGVPGRMPQQGRSEQQTKQQRCVADGGQDRDQRAP